MEDCVIVEVKSVERLAPIHSAQLITYLKLLRSPVGLLLNFKVTSLRRGIRRLENRPQLVGAVDLENEDETP